jgi:PAS domain S-box-containing protein
MKHKRLSNSVAELPEPPLLEASNPLLVGVFDAMRLLVAILDHQGVIRMVNAEWNVMAARNGSDIASCGVGVNYLEVCRRAAAAGSRGAAEVAAAIERLLAGSSQSFNIDYSCLVQTRVHWFNLRLLSFQMDQQIGILVTHEDITRQRLVQKTLDKVWLVARKMFNGIVIFDALGRIEWVNEGFTTITGVSIPDAMGSPVMGVLGGAEANESLRDFFATGAPRDSTLNTQISLRRPNHSSTPASLVWVDIRIDPLMRENGITQQFVAILNDVTESKLSQQALVTIVHHERERLAHDLHDGLGQELAGASMMIGAIVTANPQLAPGVRDDLMYVASILRDSIKTCQSVAWDFSSTISGRDGLLGALRDLVERTKRRYKVKVELRAGSQRPLIGLVADHLYRIAQEAISNALKSAQPQKIVVSFREYKNCTVLCITDDGVGIDPAAASGGIGAGMGLRIMRHRANVIGAELFIGPLPGGGTQVRCKYIHNTLDVSKHVSPVMVN